MERGPPFEGVGETMSKKFSLADVVLLAGEMGPVLKEGGGCCLAGTGAGAAA